MEFKNYTIQYPESHVAVVTLTPEPGAKVFQFSQVKLQELIGVYNFLEQKTGIKVVILTGVGKVFAAGGDISEMKNIIENNGAVAGGSQFAATGQALMDHIEKSGLISIVAFNGSAVGGGCEISLACDYRIAAEGVKLGQPEINLGLIPGWGGTRRLERFIGLARAKYLIYTGELISAETAYQWGLIQEVIPVTSDLMESALAVARKMTCKSGQILSYCKESIHAGLWLDDISAQNTERRLFGECFSTPDTREGLTAFLEKRKADFRN